jgi:hypothetical protein
MTQEDRFGSSLQLSVKKKKKKNAESDIFDYFRNDF